MSAIENKEFIRKYIEDVHGGKPKTLELLQKYTTDQPLIDHILSSEEAFPSYGLDVEEMIAEADLVSIRGRVRGINSGPFMGGPPTGKEVNFPMFITYRINEGKIVDHWMIGDVGLMMQQLGIKQTEEWTA